MEREVRTPQRRQRPAPLRRLRDDGRDRLRRPRARAGARGDRRRGLCRHRPRPARLPRRGRRAARAPRGRPASSSSAASSRCASPSAERLRRGHGRACSHTLDLFDAAGAEGARPVLCDAGGPERIANPGRGGEDASLRLDDARWRTLADNVERARRRRSARGYRARLPPPHVDLRRGAAGDRAPARGHRRRAAARLRAPRGRGRRPGRRRCATGASGSGRSTSRTCGSTCSQASRRSAPTR